MEITKNLLVNQIKEHLLTKPFISLENKGIEMLSHSLPFIDDTEKRNCWLFVFDHSKKQLISDREIETFIQAKSKEIPNSSLFYKSTFNFPLFHVILINLNHSNFMTIKNYSCEGVYYTRNKPAFYYKRKGTYLLFHDSLAIKRFWESRNVWIDALISENIDFCNGQLLEDMPMFQLVRDFRKERVVKNHIPGELTYSQILNGKNRHEVLANKFKTLPLLTEYFNPNKLKYWEIGLFRSLRLKLTDKEFRRVINWYQKKGRKTCYQYWQERFKRTSAKSAKITYQDVYCLYLMKRFCLTVYYKDPLSDDFYKPEWFTVLDYIRLFRIAHKNKKLEVNRTSWARFCQEEEQLSVQVSNLNYKQFYKTSFNRTKEWQPLLKRLEKSSLQVTHLNTGEKLILEGNAQHNCVGSYIEKAAQNKCLLLDYTYKNRRHTVEIINQGSKTHPTYTIFQCLTALNQPAVKGAVEALEKVIS